MQLIQGKTNVIVVGAWNPAIVAPNWIAREIFDKPKMEVNWTVEVADGQKPRARFALGRLLFIPTEDRLTIVPENLSDDSLTLAEKTTALILRRLPHTPIQALGQNFQFFEDAPGKDRLAVFDFKDDLSDRIGGEIDLLGVSVGSRLNLGDRTLNLTRSFSRSTGEKKPRLIVDCNFHYAVSKAEDAAAALEAGAFAKNRAIALKIADLAEGDPAELKFVEVADA